MNRIVITLKLLLLSALSTITHQVMAAEARDTHKPAVHVMSPWAKPNFGPNGAVYFTLHNHGNKACQLIGVSSPLSERVEIHEHIHENGVMKMRKVKNNLVIAPLDTLIFEPGGLHVMLFKMKKKLKDGAVLPLTLKFSDGREQNVEAKVRANQPEGEKHHSGH